MRFTIHITGREGANRTMANDDAIRQIRERLDIVEVIGQYVQLKKTGKTYSGNSPFRTERTPSFHVWPEAQRGATSVATRVAISSTSS